MRKQLLQKFIDRHPNHTLTPYFKELIENDLLEFNTLRDVILTAIRKQLLNPSEIGQTDILMANMSLVKE